MPLQSYTCSLAFPHSCTSSHTLMHVGTLIHSCIYVYTSAHIPEHTNPCVQTYTHTDLLTHLHTQMFIYFCTYNTHSHLGNAQHTNVPIHMDAYFYILHTYTFTHFIHIYVYMCILTLKICHCALSHTHSSIYTETYRCARRLARDPHC